MRALAKELEQMILNFKTEIYAIGFGPTED